MMVRRVLVTGGTGTIGRALVRRFAIEHPVIFQYRQNSRVANQLEQETGAQGWQADLREENIEVPEEITILINNAGINEGDERTSDVSESAWREAIEINLTATWRVTRQCLPAMVAAGWGRIITISSIYGYRAAVGNLPYTVSKHGLRGLTATMALEYGEKGITANEICPGPVDSNMLRRIAEEQAGTEGREQYLRDVSEDLPIKRLIMADEVAWAAAFLAAEESGGINGISLPVDGGMTA